MTLTLPPLEYTLYLPKLSAHHPVLMLHGFATRGDQLFGGTGWIRQYIRAGYPVITVNLPYHTGDFLKDPQFRVDPKVPPGTRVHSGSVPVHGGEGLEAYTRALHRVLGEALPEAGIASAPAHLVGFSFGARTGWEMAVQYPEAVTSLVLGGLPFQDHLGTLQKLLNAHPNLPAEYANATERDRAFKNIIAASPITARALADFVRVPYTSFNERDIIAGAYPRCPTLIAAGTADTVAADAGKVFELIRTKHPGNTYVDIPGRNHINALTSGVFRRAALAFAREVDAAEQ